MSGMLRSDTEGIMYYVNVWLVGGAIGTPSVYWLVGGAIGTPSVHWLVGGDLAGVNKGGSSYSRQSTVGKRN